MVGESPSALAPTSEPRVMVSLSRGSSVHELLLIGTPLWAITDPWSLAHARLELNFRSAFTTPLACASRPKLVPHPCLLVYRPYVSLSPSHPCTPTFDDQSPAVG